MEWLSLWGILAGKGKRNGEVRSWNELKGPLELKESDCM